MLTRAAMSCARAVRLCNIMGLHRLDDPEYEMQMMPTILPAQSWLELEERYVLVLRMALFTPGGAPTERQKCKADPTRRSRRTFWASFCVNSHVSIYSGWPGIIDAATVRFLTWCRVMSLLLSSIGSAF